MLDVISMFRDQDTRDELGLGVVRDVIAESLFPGTSTIQTRARYFLFIPWMYMDLERRKIRSSEIAKAARRFETNLIDALVTSGETQGVIGIEARKDLKRLPSNIYWSGLATWGIRLFAGSQDQYHRSVDRLYGAASQVSRTDDGDVIIPCQRNWNAAIPQAPVDFEHTATLKLTSSEAAFLQNQVLTRHHQTMLGFLLDRGELWDSVDFPWLHPCSEQLPDRLRGILRHGEYFSLSMRGAALLYNLLLAVNIANEERVVDYRSRLDGWTSLVQKRMEDLLAWDRAAFWKLVSALGPGGVTVSVLTQAFIDRWLDLVLTPGFLKRAKEDASARRLIEDREKTLKGPRARIGNKRALEMWTGAAGTGQLEYRWSRVQRIIQDVLQGLGRK
jgi:hypothetical protein